jgi:competence protein ComEA
VTDNQLADAAIVMADGFGLHKRLQFETSRTLMNGSEVNVRKRPDGPESVTIGWMPVSELMILGIPLNISTMTEEDFDRLPGVGPALAKRIIEYRQNNGGVLRFEDLIMIEGIGKKKLESLRIIIQPTVNTK